MAGVGGFRARFARLYELVPGREGSALFLALVATLVGLLLFLQPGAAAAADFHCTAGDVACLIAAINSANATLEADTILLDAGTYTLTVADNNGPDGPAGLPAIASDILLKGAGQDSTIIERHPTEAVDICPEPAAGFRLLLVASTGSLSLEAVRVRNGCSATEGGAILNRGTLKVTSAMLDGSYAASGGNTLGGGISNHGYLTLTDSTVASNHTDFGPGGGIYSDGSLTIVRSTVVHNHSQQSYAGGVATQGDASITSSTITNNWSDYCGGGLYIEGVATVTDSSISGNQTYEEGAAFCNAGVTSVWSTTIAANFGEDGVGAGISNYATLHLYNCTVAENTNMFGAAGIITGSPATLTIQDTIVAGNTIYEGAAIPTLGPDCAGPLLSLGHNLIGDLTDCSVALLATDRTGDAGLGGFTDDGVAGHSHVPLLVSSQAIDAGDPAACPPTDQLGQARADGDGDGTVVCDIGAVEYPPPTFHCSAGNVACLIAAINAANADPGADTIILDAGAYTLTAADNMDENGFEANGLPIVTTKISIRGAGALGTIIQRSPEPSTPFFRILRVEASGDLTLDSLTIQNGDIQFSAGGGGIFNLGTTKVIDSVLTRNIDDGGNGGGGIRNGGTLELVRSRLENNFGSDTNAGGILSFGTLTVTQSSISGNGTEDLSGGGILAGGTVVISDSSITGNRGGTGGGLFFSGGTFTITNTTVAGNYSFNGPGGILLSAGSLRIDDSTIAGNVSDGVNGVAGIYNAGGDVELQNTILAGNSNLPAPPEAPRDCLGLVFSAGHNLVGDPSGCNITLDSSDLTGDPGLGSLQDDGTPGNGHYPLLAGSPAVDAGDVSTCTRRDQLGQPRRDGDGDGTIVCDIGAIEFQPPLSSPTPTPTSTMTPTPTPTPTPGSPTGTATPTPTIAMTPTQTHTPSVTPTPTPTVTQVPTVTSTPTPTLTPTSGAGVTPTPTITPTPSPRPSVTPTQVLPTTSTPSATPTVTPTVGAGGTATHTPTITPSRTPTPTPMPTTVPTSTPTVATPTATPRVTPWALEVDTSPGSGSYGNGVLERGEAVPVRPVWKNLGGSPVSFSAKGSDFSGPAGATYILVDDSAGYSIGGGATAGCASTADCYRVSVSTAGPRPATHWDSQFKETLDLSGGPAKVWKLHVGESFTDVPRSYQFYKPIETVLHQKITLGCTTTTYCPDDKVRRDQMAIFLARAIAGGAANIPQSGTVGSSAYNCSAGGISLFSDVAPTDGSCRSIHYIAAQNVTTGCGGGAYCVGLEVARADMSIFVTRAMVAPAGGSAVPMIYGPDPVTGLSYSCNSGSPSLHFTDVSVSDAFCKHVHYLWAKGLVGGCGQNQFCAAGLVTRGEMAKFLTNAFGLRLYGP